MPVWYYFMRHFKGVIWHVSRYPSWNSGTGIYSVYITSLLHGECILWSHLLLESVLYPNFYATDSTIGTFISVPNIAYLEDRYVNCILHNLWTRGFRMVLPTSLTWVEQSFTLVPEDAANPLMECLFSNSYFIPRTMGKVQIMND